MYNIYTVYTYVCVCVCVRTVLSSLPYCKQVSTQFWTVLTLEPLPQVRNRNTKPGSGSCTLGETTSSSQEMLISVICCVTGRAAVEPLGDSALADEGVVSVASMIWMAEDSVVGLLVTLLEAAGTEQPPQLMRRSMNNQSLQRGRRPWRCSKSGNTYPLC